MLSKVEQLQQLHNLDHVMCFFCCAAGRHSPEPVAGTTCNAGAVQGGAAAAPALRLVPKVSGTALGWSPWFAQETQKFK